MTKILRDGEDAFALWVLKQEGRTMTYASQSADIKFKQRGLLKFRIITHK